MAIDASGQVTFTSYLNSAGGTTPPTGLAVQLDPATGAITRAADATFHGRMAFGKDFYVRTAGAATSPSLNVSLE